MNSSDVFFINAHHKLDGVQEALMELCMLEVILWTVNTVKHATGTACGSSELLLTGVLHSTLYIIQIFMR